MDASSTRAARGIPASVRVRGGSRTQPSETEVAPTRAVTPPSAFDNSHQDLDRRPSDSKREARKPLTDPVGRALLHVLAHEESQRQADTQSALLRAKAYARPANTPIVKPTSDG